MNSVSSDGLRSLVRSRPGSALSRSRDGEGFTDLDVVGTGNLEDNRGMLLGARPGVLGCLSMVKLAERGLEDHIDWTAESRISIKNDRKKEKE